MQPRAATIRMKRFLAAAAVMEAVHAHVMMSDPSPPSPTWPDHFTASFDVYLRMYGPYWKSPGGGRVAYSASQPHTMHSYYYDVCPPMWDNITEPLHMDFTCEFLFFGVNSTVYYLNPDGKDPHHPQCCIFATGLDPPAQDFCSTCTYVSNTSLHGSTTDWWVQGDTGFTYASYVDAQHAPASLWASLAPQVGVLQVDYTSFNTSMVDPREFQLPTACAAAPVCVDVGTKSKASHMVGPGVVARR